MENWGTNLSSGSAEESRNEAVRAFDVAVGALPTDLEKKRQGMFPFTTRFSS